TVRGYAADVRPRRGGAAARGRAARAGLPQVDVGVGDVLRVGIEVLERAGRDARAVDELVDVGFLQPDDAAEFVGGQVTVIDQAIQCPHGDAELFGRLLGAHPMDVGVDVAGGHFPPS